MKTGKILFFIMTSAFLFSGCALPLWTHLNEQDYRDNSRSFSARLPQDWMKLNFNKNFFITKDGLSLNLIMVSRLSIKDRLEFTNKKYERDMLVTDLAEIEKDNLSLNKNWLQFKILSNEPLRISNYDGYRLEYSYETKNGLPIRGILCGFQHNAWIYQIRFEATEQHYYEENVKIFEKFLSSFRLIK
ncbi:MAG: hypothetical protein HQL26_05260 [Candidatus Omnitrophica bacterium]|nr:hypothetical protein [Candidatus Omnitrophota bacterium]